MIKSLKPHKASWSVFSNSVFISMETEMAAWSLLQGCNYSCSSCSFLSEPSSSQSLPWFSAQWEIEKGKALGS